MTAVIRTLWLFDRRPRADIGQGAVREMDAAPGHLTPPTGRGFLWKVRLNHSRMTSRSAFRPRAPDIRDCGFSRRVRRDCVRACRPAEADPARSRALGGACSSHRKGEGERHSETNADRKADSDIPLSLTDDQAHGDAQSDEIPARPAVRFGVFSVKGVYSAGARSDARRETLLLATGSRAVGG